jgi:hypothetical protein
MITFLSFELTGYLTLILFSLLQNSSRPVLIVIYPNPIISRYLTGYLTWILFSLLKNSSSYNSLIWSIFLNLSSYEIYFNMITFPAALAQPTLCDVMVWRVTEAELMVCRVTKAARIESNRCVIDNIFWRNVYWTDLNIGWINIFQVSKNCQQF